uniref:Core-2/I-branching beta-1,6-N-acetylglucosaminyltransferase family protein n=1 Tax=Chenopodium quinoa TaxID=63459 RepID=A0A803N9J6_CHEQI
MLRNNKAEKVELEKLTAQQNNGYLKKFAPTNLIRLVVCLMVFIAGVATGLVSSSQRSTISLENYTKIYTAVRGGDTTIENINCLSLDKIVHPKKLSHDLSDQELVWRASLVPKVVGYPFKRVPKVAFMFLTRGPLPLLPLWEKYFAGHDGFFSIYVHTQAGFVFDVPSGSVFFGRQVPSKEVSWGDVSLADAEKRLLANALLDFSNERFVLLSESCIPVYDFQTVYKYLTKSAHSFVESYDDTSRFGRGRYDRHMRPNITVEQWRKGAQWFEIRRDLGIEIISDYKYYDLFRKYCHPPCFPDEHYVATYLNIFHAPLNSNRTLTWVDWSLGGPHPTTFVRENITEGFIRNIRNYKKKCLYNSKSTTVCYLFARKFAPSTLEPLLNLSSKLMGF